ncbi:hypothetical protein HGA92_04685 [Candidatus Gracilibacteria bacterium]|nr:hypothetical protein [Candidatus Gracilibacteria bacterium]NUJ98469.1 hypothetical protein [Candidatus Gracilibacteria bacterium]
MKKLQYLVLSIFISFCIINGLYADEKIGSTIKSPYYSDDNTGSIIRSGSGESFQEKFKKINEDFDKKMNKGRNLSGAIMTQSGLYIPQSVSGSIIKKEDLKILKQDKKENIEENKEEMKKNRQEFRDDVKDLKSASGALFTNEQKEKIKALNDQMKEELEPFIEKLRQEKDIDTRKLIIEEINAIHKKYAEKVKEIVGENANLVGLIDKRIEVLDKNKDLRQENLDTRKKWREERAELIEKYKTAFMNKLKSKLDTISADKLEKVLTKVNTMIQTTTNNKKLTQASKDKILAQLEALKEILENKIDETTIINDEVDLEALFG